MIMFACASLREGFQQFDFVAVQVHRFVERLNLAGLSLRVFLFRFQRLRSHAFDYQRCGARYTQVFRFTPIVAPCVSVPFVPGEDDVPLGVYGLMCEMHRRTDLATVSSWAAVDNREELFVCALFVLAWCGEASVEPTISVLRSRA